MRTAKALSFLAKRSHGSQDYYTMTKSACICCQLVQLALDLWRLGRTGNHYYMFAITNTLDQIYEHVVYTGAPYSCCWK